jgi:hypothetical protein
LAVYYDTTQDESILAALTRHFLDAPYDYSTGRNACNIEAMVWLYGKTGDKQLLDLAENTYLEMDRRGIFPDDSLELCFDYMLSEDFADCHGVSYCEVGKLGAVLYAVTGKQKYLDVSAAAYRTLERYSMLVDGVPSSAEFMHGKTGLDSHETCVVTDFTWGLGYLMNAQGEAAYADQLEKAIFNALPGCVGEDFKTLQYFSSPNQVIADAHSNHNLFCQGTGLMSFRPNPGTECCPGNVNRAMPDFVGRMWERDRDGGVVASVYGPSSFTFKIDNIPITITEETDYPFSEQILFRFSLPEGKSAEFDFVYRIPGWCESAGVNVNGEPETGLFARTFRTLRRVFQDGDRVELTLPMAIRISRWPENGVAVERGPLVFALKIKQDWRIDPDDEHSTKSFPAYNFYAASPWNYAIVLPPDDELRYFNIKTRPVGERPFSLDGAPITISAKARRLDGWDLRRETAVIENHIPFARVSDDELAAQPIAWGDFAFTPALPTACDIGKMSGELEDIELIPYGAAKLRISVFPSVKG